MSAVEAAAAQAVAVAWSAGCPVARDAETIAPVAVRRWNSSRRRAVDPADFEARVEDLTQGLVQRLEPEPRAVGPLIEDYRYLARLIGERLRDLAASGADGGT